MLRVSMAYIVEVEFGDILPRPAMGLSVTPIASAQFTGGAFRWTFNGVESYWTLSQPGYCRGGVSAVARYCCQKRKDEARGMHYLPNRTDQVGLRDARASSPRRKKYLASIAAKRSRLLCFS